MEQLTPKYESVLVFYVNGKKIMDDSVNPEWTLIRYLREKLHLPGTKQGCAEGGCGACTVMVSKLNRRSEKVNHFSVNACLTPIGAMHGLAVTTTEGIGSTRTRLHPVQERIAKAHGTQCGFCTPGFVMSMYTLLRNNPKPTMEEIEESLVGNLCRCTGYRPILEGFRTFSKEANEVKNSCGKKDCCMLNNTRNTNNAEEKELVNGYQMEATTILFDPQSFHPYDPSQEIIFPPELKLTPQLDCENLVLKGPNVTFFRPVTLQEVLRLKKLYPQAKIVVGNTEVGLEVKFKNQLYPVIIHPSHIDELLHFKVEDSCVEIGAALPLSTIETLVKRSMSDLPDYKTQVLQSMLEMLRWFAGRQIKNVAALGGNIMTGSPISDLNPIFMAAGATLTFKSVDGEREVPLDNNFFTGYRKNIVRDDEVLTSVKIPFTDKNDFFMTYKQSKRRDDDIAIVNSAMKVTIEPENGTVESVTLAFGGMGPTTVLAKQTMQTLTGCKWNDESLQKAISSLIEELTLDPSVPGGMVDYRLALTVSFFFKFFLHVQHEIHQRNSQLCPPLMEDQKELIKPFENKGTKSTQFFQNVPEGQEKIDPVGRPIQHLSSLKQTTGEATFIDDLIPLVNELHGALVTSTRAYAKILSIDATKVLQMEGVRGFFSAADVPGDRNICSGMVSGEEVFAREQVNCIGAVIGIVVATERDVALRASKLVDVQYEDLPNPIFTIEEAIAANSMWDVPDGPLEIESGDVNEAFGLSDHVLEGETRLGGQEHFYLEPNVHIAIPHEDNEMEMICSSQSLPEVQRNVANALGIPSNRVTAKVKRTGGGFGGKESRNLAIIVPIAVAAASLQQPVRITLDRDEDMVITGGRHPFLGRWKIGFNKDGIVNAMETKYYSNAGYTLDNSRYVMEVAVFNANGPYKIDNIKVSGHICKTNLPSNTAFRAFGNPQTLLILESAMSRVSEFLKLHGNEVRKKNLYQYDSVYTTHYGQEFSNCNVSRCWEQVMAESNFEERKKLVDEYNRRNTYRKRGISVIPMKYGVGLTVKFLNQAGALVLVYTDGSVLLSHGGMEMGQGLHTKMIQVASRVLQIPMEKIYIAETSTDKVPNATATCGSISSDLNGMAVMDACKKIVERLDPYKKKMPKGEWKNWVSAAYMDRVSLSATGYFKLPGLVEYSFAKKTPANPTTYYTYCASIAEVEIDCLTGDHQVLRVDIVMDVGNSLNPAIDIGQIEGAFLQGYGLFTMEQLLYSPSGALLTKGPAAYKIPSVMDIPREFNVSLLRDSSNPRAIFSSKAIGEPPLLSGMSVFFALREAVRATREDDNETPLVLESPATAERLRMACKDWITEKIKPSTNTSFTPWAIDVSH